MPNVVVNTYINRWDKLCTDVFDIDVADHPIVPFIIMVVMRLHHKVFV